MLLHPRPWGEIAVRSNAGYDFTIDFRGFTLFAM
ncbi:hypothetical protein GGD54_000390 [Rhizobium tropici]|uniref:Uncharacterized protein n=2 Tax=Rhizobium TaxID=379 RepID=A0ABU1SK94_9HYPH|nr:hypothetical protein [Rhizobium tropici]MBB5590953.1 hypothetical protein [Rhizobium tropici]MBB6489838.1 hypothetical protein [Rhizobium tropici]MDR6898752.1 hypothetical protein [Rhizobium miluonense]